MSLSGLLLVVALSAIEVCHAQAGAVPIPDTGGGAGNVAEPVLSFEAVDMVKVVRFGPDLFKQSDIMLQGITAIEKVPFTRPRSWELARDPELHLKIEHSGTLLPGRSLLTVKVNEQSIASIPLDQSNMIGGAVVANIPRDLLADYNTISLEVVQHVGEECEDPFDPSLWLRIGKDSTLRFWFSPRVFEGDLLDFPYPYFDVLGYGPMEISLALGPRVGARQLQAIAGLGLSMGRLSAYHGFHVGELVAEDLAVDGNILVVGTPEWNPWVTRFIDVSDLEPGQGLVAAVPNPLNPRYGVLIVTGADSEGFDLAAAALAAQDRYQVLSGTRAIVTELQQAKPPPTRQSPLPLPAQKRFSLADMDIGDKTVRGYYAPPVRLPLRMLGDAKVRDGGARLGLDFAYAAHLDTRLSSLEVRLNGVTLRSIALDDPDGEELTRLWVDLPFEILEPSSEIEVIFHLFPEDFQPCVYTTDRHIWGTVFASSELVVNRDHYSMLPDLSLLRYDLWPLGHALGEEGLLVVTSSVADSRDTAALLALSAELGRTSVSDSIELTVLPSRSGLMEEARDRTMVLLVGDSRHETYEELVSQRQLTLFGDFDRQLVAGATDLLKARVGTPYGTIEQVVNPFDPEHSILVLRGQSQLLSVVESLANPGLLLQMEGNAVVLASEERLRSIDVAQQVQVGTIPLISRIQAFSRRAWFFWGIGLLVAAFVAAGLIRTWASKKGGQT